MDSKADDKDLFRELRRQRGILLLTTPRKGSAINPERQRMVKVLKQKSDFSHGDSIQKPFVVEDGNLITARYPADAHVFAQKLIDKLQHI